MLDFLRRIPEFLGLKLKPVAKPGGTAQPEARPANGAANKLPRGRGTGRGVTPPGKPKGSAPRRSTKR